MASLTLPVPLERAGWRFVALAAAAPVVLGLARLLPLDAPVLAVRLATAAVCVLLLPGALAVRAFAWPASAGLAVATSLVWSLVFVFVALSLTFAASGSLSLAVVVLTVVALAAAASAAVTAAPRPPFARSDVIALLAVAVVGLLLGVAVWWVARTVAGDGLFHLARIRKLDEVPTLFSIKVVDEFRNGGPHPGYAFPLWHGVVALVARLAGADPTTVYLHLPALLTPLALVVAYATGASLFGSWAGGVATAAAQTALAGLGTAGVGTVEYLTDPEAAARLILIPALLALFFSYVRGARRAVLLSLAAAGFVLAVVHPTYALFLALPLLGYLVARLVLARDDRQGLKRCALALGAVLGATGCFLLWLLPFIRQATAVSQSAAGKASALAHFSQDVVVSGGHFRLSAGAMASTTDVVVAFLVIPLAVLAARRRWAAFVLGSTVVVLLLVLVPVFFTPFANAVSLSQARRLAGFLPFAFALAGAATLAGRLRLFGCAAAAALAVGVHFAFRNEFAPAPRSVQLGWVPWLALGAGVAAIVVGAILGRRGPEPDPWTAAVAGAFVLPLAALALVHLERDAPDRFAPDARLVHAIRANAAPRDVVLANPELSYRLAAYVPVDIVAAPLAHVAQTTQNLPRQRLRDDAQFFRHGVSDFRRRQIITEYEARWVVVDKQRSVPRSILPYLDRVFEDRRFALYRTGPP